MQIYVLEPREERLDGLASELAGAGMAVEPIDEGSLQNKTLLSSAHSNECAAFLLAESDGLEKQIDDIRTGGCDSPIVVMRDFRSARATADAINSGADQDMVIPIKGLELRARIESTIRRSKGLAHQEVQVGGIRAFLDGRDPEIEGHRVKLSRKEHEIFHQLVLNAEQVTTKASIYDAVYSLVEVPPFDKVVDVYICKIRKKFDEVAEAGSAYIETVKGRGYRLSADAFRVE